MRAIGLVEAEDIVIDVPGLHVDQPVRGIGDRIDADPCAAVMDETGEIRDGMHLPQDVGHMRHADQTGAVGHQRGQIGQLQVHRVRV